MISSPVKACLTLAALALPAGAFAAPLPKPPQFAQCAVCHKVDEGAKHGLGPTLWGVGGTKAGEMAGFAFSPAMKNSGLVWNKANLVNFIIDPKKTIPGNKMAFPGQKNAAVANALADYLLSLK